MDGVATLSELDAEFVETLRQAKADVRLLLGYVSGRSDRTIESGFRAERVPGVVTPPAVGEGKDAFLRELAEVLATPAELLAASPQDSAFLLGALDYLACLAYPANAPSIRLTRAFAESATAAEERDGVLRRAAAWAGTRGRGGGGAAPAARGAAGSGEEASRAAPGWAPPAEEAPRARAAAPAGNEAGPSPRGADPAPPPPDPDRFYRQQGTRLRRGLSQLTWIGLAALALFVLTMVHVVDGQTAAENVRALRTEHAALQSRIAAAEATLGTAPTGGGVAAAAAEAVPFVPLCDRRAPPAEAPAAGAAGGNGTSRPRPRWLLSPPQAQLCAELAALEDRMAIAQRALAEWNDATAAWLRNSPARWMVPSGLSYDAPPREREWRATELRTAGMLTALTVYIIPAILGLLGACAYVLRQFNAKIEASSLDTSDKLQGLVRVFLGLVVGGLVGIVFLPSGTEMQGVRLSIAALAFLAGYAVQVVFELLDWFVERGSRAMRERLPPPMAQPAPPSPAPVAASRGGGRGATVLVTPAAGGGGTNDNAAADPGSAPAAAPGGAAPAAAPR